MKFSIKQVVVLISFVILIICYNYYLTWKFYPLRTATASEKLNFKNYQDFNHGMVDEFNKKVYVLFYGSNPSSTSNNEKPTAQPNNQNSQQMQDQNVNKPCSGPGDQSCSNAIRERFQSKGQEILDLSYNGNGVFMVTFIDNSGNGGSQALVDVSCDCKILDVRIAN
jgi:hypothetical protein